MRQVGWQGVVGRQLPLSPGCFSQPLILAVVCAVQELKAVQLRSLNRERAEMIAEEWLASGQVGRLAAGCQPRQGRGRSKHTL